MTLDLKSGLIFKLVTTALKEKKVIVAACYWKNSLRHIASRLMMKVGKPGRVSIMIAHIHPASKLYTVQDFLCELDMKPNINIIYSSFKKTTLRFVYGCYTFIRYLELSLLNMHLLEIRIFSQYNVITRPTKIINTLLKDRKILSFFQH